jgi:CBS domain containing-hemolysin-like protein
VIEWALILLSVALIGACGVFVAAEFAFVTVDRAAVERAAEAGERGARGTRQALRSLSTQLSGAQLGITVTNLAIGFLAEPAIATLLRGPLEALWIPADAVPGVAVVVALVLATSVTMIFGELVPKNLAIARPMRTAAAVQGFQRGFTTTTGPVIRALNGLANLILGRLGIEPQEELASARSAEELTSLINRSAQQGTLADDTARMLARTLAFGDLRARDVATPRVRMVTVAATDPISEVLTTARRTGHSRFPVTGRDIDDVVGVIHVKHAVAVPLSERRATAVSGVMVEPVVVPESLEVDLLLDTLRRGGLQLAVLIDEFGGTDGVVTMEDLVEEIVGDVDDEHDRGDSGRDRLRQVSADSWLLSGLLRPDELRTDTGLFVPDSRDYETVAGLVTEGLGRIPQRGDVVRCGDAEFTVERMDGMRADRLRMRRCSEEDPS